MKTLGPVAREGSKSPLPQRYCLLPKPLTLEAVSAQEGDGVPFSHSHEGQGTAYMWRVLFVQESHVME